jgi:hypothetical protein
MSRKDHVSTAARGFASLAAGILCGVMLVQTASASTLTPPEGEVSAGILEMRLGASNTVRSLDPDGNLLDGPANEQLFYFQRRNDCRLRAPSNTDVQTELLKFSATNDGAAAAVGLVAGSMGVYAGSQGTPCSRFDSGLRQELGVALGKDSPAPSFYLLELDIEAKGNLALEMLVFAKGSSTPSSRHLMLTGGSRTDYAYNAADFDSVYSCPATKASDSGPDAGDADNCRWTVRAYGASFRLVPKVGLGSLEGGADTGIPTRVHLTNSITGTLGCNTTASTGVEVTPTLGDGERVAQCTVTRVDTGSNEIGEACTENIAYVLRSIAGAEQGCEILKAPGEQLAASLRITFPPEARTELDADELLTKISFSTGDPQNPLTAPFTPRRCLGTVVIDKNWTRTIQEVLGATPRPDWVVDQVTGDIVDWACVLDHEEVYIGDDEMQTAQTILFWGDIRFTRE